jgi:hypothetical protein
MWIGGTASSSASITSDSGPPCAPTLRGAGRSGQTGERFYEAELYRLKDDLSLKSRQVETSLESGVRSRGAFSQGHRDYPAAECEILGTAGSNELEPAVAATRQEG